jgi:hypothetical protein
VPPLVIVPHEPGGPWKSESVIATTSASIWERHHEHARGKSGG